MKATLLAAATALGLAAAAPIYTATGDRPDVLADGGDYVVTNQSADGGDYVVTNQQVADGGDYVGNTPGAAGPAGA
jgi:hypothetical protein